MPSWLVSPSEHSLGGVLQAAQAYVRNIDDGATGALLFDADGNGAAAAMRFATLSTGLATTAS